MLLQLSVQSLFFCILGKEELNKVLQKVIIIIFIIIIIIIIIIFIIISKLLLNNKSINLRLMLLQF